MQVDKNTNNLVGMLANDTVKIGPSFWETAWFVKKEENTLQSSCRSQ